jgi:hypothetical protein
MKDKVTKWDVPAINQIDKLIDLEDDEIRSLYNSWDKGDCSLVGIVELYLFQCRKKHKEENGEYYDTDYDQIILRLDR